LCPNCRTLLLALSWEPPEWLHKIS
jgi:hypothetical protein